MNQRRRTNRRHDVLYYYMLTMLMASAVLTIVVDMKYAKLANDSKTEDVYNAANEAIPLGYEVSGTYKVQVDADHSEELIIYQKIEETDKSEVTPVVVEPVELVADKTDVTKLSNATIDELNAAIKSTCKWMYEYDPNLGEVYYNMEQEYGINAFFAMSVSMNEVGVQDMSYLAREKNNTYGIMRQDPFESIEHCIEYFFDLIKDHYVGEGRLTVTDISKKYCVGNPQWVKAVHYFMEVLPERSRM